MTTERKMLPLPEPEFEDSEPAERLDGSIGWATYVYYDGATLKDYALANMAPLEAEIARLREALEHISGLSRSQFWQTQDMLDAILDVAAAALREAE
jgi:hypothetical protein